MNSVLGPMTRERIEARRKLYADGGEDEGERTERMLQDILGGVSKELSPAVTNDEDALLWDALAADIERGRREGDGYIISFGLPASEDF